MSFLRRICCCLCPGSDESDSNTASASSSWKSHPPNPESRSQSSDSSQNQHANDTVHIQIRPNSESPVAASNSAFSDDMIEMESMLPSASSGSSLSNDPLFHLPPLDQNPPLTPQQLQRAWELSRWSSLDLGWRVLADPAPGRTGYYFYFNVWTGETVWHPPKEVSQRRTRDNQKADLAIPGHIAWIGKLVQKFRERGIELSLWDPTTKTKERRGLLAGHPVNGSPPCLWHILFYAHVLWNELSLYPRSFLRSVGLTHIILADQLRYDSQTRSAIPLIETGTLLLDPRLEEIMYVTSVLHHELFHMIDCHMIYRSEHHSRKRALREKARGSNNRSNGRDHHYDSDIDFEDDTREFDFDTAMDPLEASQPLALHALTAVSSLHGVPDKAWSKYNVAGFRYGTGGALARGHDMFLSSSLHNNQHTTGVFHGFLNAYSQTAVEEDKAEIYAALIRNCGAILGESDEILRSKAREMQKRLAWFCPQIDQQFWQKVQLHTPHPARPSSKNQNIIDEATANRTTSPANNATTSSPLNAQVAPSPTKSGWEERVDHAGHKYYFNVTTKQTSWIKPQWM